MADAKQCDRCKEYYETYKNRKGINGMSFLEIGSRSYRVDKTKDLCPNCLKKLENWMNMEDNQ